MKAVGLITEYNPFHNGHLYHIKKAKELTNADYCVVVMSGSFVQRGAPAVYDKYMRTRMALLGGADLVLEMPCLFSTASAKEFAAYGVDLLDSLGVIDHLCFGSECGDLSLLQSLAFILSSEPKEYSVSLKGHLKTGITFPRARAKAFEAYLTSHGKENDHLLQNYKIEPIIHAFEQPNNILGIEYCQAIIELNSRIKPLTIKREDNGYHDTSIRGTMGSALAIRTALSSGLSPESLSELVPEYAVSLMKETLPVYSEDFSLLLNYKIMNTARQPEKLNQYLDLSDELASRLCKSTLECSAFDARVKSLKSRQITYTRASRALMHLLLDIKEADLIAQKNAGYAGYARILGFKKQSSPLLALIKKNSRIPVIAKLADAGQLLDQTNLYTLEQEIHASHIYQMIKQEKGGDFLNEYSTPITIL